MIGIFDNPEVTLADGVPNGSHTPERLHLKPTEEASIGRGRTYYKFAYSYSEQIHGRNHAITDVLEKLSQGFDKFLLFMTRRPPEYTLIPNTPLSRTPAKSPYSSGSSITRK